MKSASTNLEIPALEQASLISEAVIREEVMPCCSSSVASSLRLCCSALVSFCSSSLFTCCGSQLKAMLSLLDWRWSTCRSSQISVSAAAAASTVQVFAPRLPSGFAKSRLVEAPMFTVNFMSDSFLLLMQSCNAAFESVHFLSRMMPSANCCFCQSACAFAASSASVSALVLPLCPSTGVLLLKGLSTGAALLSGACSTPPVSWPCDSLSTEPGSPGDSGGSEKLTARFTEGGREGLSSPFSAELKEGLDANDIAGDTSPFSSASSGNGSLSTSLCCAEFLIDSGGDTACDTFPSPCTCRVESHSSGAVAGSASALCCAGFLNDSGDE
mmetsp:Transcript_61413/g.134467  ORF Transcript_61413/g.134467 Transcript_61413/m.134467 type:complete len:328 (-) Transcript_61413:21-1004(-)